MQSRRTLDTRPLKQNRHPLRSVIRLLPVLLIVVALLLPVAQPLLVRAQSSNTPEVVVGQIDGTITPVMARYVERAIKNAEKSNAAAIVFEMDTPGGLSSAMDDIIRDILESDMPVVVYVTPRGARAASAGGLYRLRGPMSSRWHPEPMSGRPHPSSPTQLGTTPMATTRYGPKSPMMRSVKSSISPIYAVAMPSGPSKRFAMRSTSPPTKLSQ